MNFKVCSIKQLPSLILELEQSNNLAQEISPYQYSAWQGRIVEDFYHSNLLKVAVKTEVCVYENNGAKAIFPYQYRRFAKDGEIMFLGSGGMSDYLNLIYNEQFSYTDFVSVIQFVSKRTGRKRFYFNLLQEKSRIYGYLQQFSIICDETNECVHIDLPDLYEDYFQSLSKSTRQNIRTSINRLEKAGLQREFRVITNRELSVESKQEMINVYQERYKIKNQDSSKSKAQMIKQNIMHGSGNLISDALGNTDGTLMIAEYIEGKLAAYAFILIGKDQRTVCVPRVATAETFYFYSPGMLLLIDFIHETYSCDSIVEGIKIIDLTNGDEAYKFKLGGISDNPTHKIRFVV